MASPTKSMQELTHDLQLMEERLANLEKRFVNVEHRTMVFVNSVPIPTTILTDESKGVIVGDQVRYEDTIQSG